MLETANDDPRGYTERAGELADGTLVEAAAGREFRVLLRRNQEVGREPVGLFEKGPVPLDTELRYSVRGGWALELEDGKAKGAREGRGVGRADGERKLGPLAPGQRWTVARKREAVPRLLRGGSGEMLSRELGVEIYRLERWREKALGGIDAVLREREGDPLPGSRLSTVRGGWVWLFTAAEHWNGEYVGWHLCKRGDRYAALEPISQGLRGVYGSLEADAARRLALRMDHGTQYLSDHFVNQVRFRGIEASYAFLEEPQTNGVAERFNRTLKEQVIYGRVFRDIEEVRAAVAAFVETYNREWLLEKNGFLSPLQVRQRWLETRGAQAAA